MNKRNSSIECLKIFAMFLIVLAHVSQALVTLHTNEGFSDNYFFKGSIATDNVQIFIINIFYFLGKLGNSIFFICSAYFLCERNERNIKKIIKMLIDVWLISVMFLIIFSISNFNITFNNILTSLLPNIMANNWYITAYILIYLIHPYFNYIIENLEKREFLIGILVSFFIYFVLCYIKPDLFFNSSLIYMTILYFMIAYQKKYLKNISNNIKINIIFIIIGIIGIIFPQIILNSLGLKMQMFSHMLNRLNQNQNPFIILTAIGLFNIFNSFVIKSDKINKISSMTLLIYILHDNIFIRDYFMPYIYVIIKNTFGYRFISIIVILFAVILFVFSIVLAQFYKYIFSNLIDIIIEKILKLSKKLEKLMVFLLNIN